MTIEEIRSAVTAAAARERVEPATICRRATGHGRLWDRLCEGKGLTLRTADRLMTWIEERRGEA